MNNDPSKKIRIGTALGTLLLLHVLVFVSCSNNSNTENNRKDSAGKTTGSGAVVSETDFAVIATDVCDCISDFENALSDEAKDLIEEASQKGGLDTVWNAFGDKDKEIYSTEGKKAFSCLEQLEKKYPFFKNHSKESLNAYRKAVEENCSEFAAAWTP